MRACNWIVESPTLSLTHSTPLAAYMEEDWGQKANTAIQYYAGMISLASLFNIAGRTSAEGWYILGLFCRVFYEMFLPPPFLYLILTLSRCRVSPLQLVAKRRLTKESKIIVLRSIRRRCTIFFGNLSNLTHRFALRRAKVGFHSFADRSRSSLWETSS